MSKTAVIYWSQTGNTEQMANAVAEGIAAAGGEAGLFSVSDITPEDALACSSLALGCPAMGAEELEETEFAPFFEAIQGSLAGKRVALFGSYGWGDGEWMRTWQAEVESAGAELVGGQGVIANYEPDDDALEACKALGGLLAS
ncbi:MAG: flavodoxin [Clostridiales bacterium]|nr:flavodoxin [Clostridiales bacterium]MCD7801491.1 flavodoxin [Clostridiales bacterium]